MEIDLNLKNQNQIEYFEHKLSEFEKTNTIVASFEQAEKQQKLLDDEIIRNTLESDNDNRGTGEEKDAEEVLFDAEVDAKSSEKKNYVNLNFKIVDTLPEIDSSHSKQDSLSEEVLNDSSLSVNNITTDKIEPISEDELRPLPSPTPSPKGSQAPTLEEIKSIEAIKLEKNKNQKLINQSSEEIKTPQPSKSKPAYSFLGLNSGGGGLSKIKKPKSEYPRMKRDEFSTSSKFKLSREGDDYYYSLKENQF
jgi:hypothetical protein